MLIMRLKSPTSKKGFNIPDSSKLKTFIKRVIWGFGAPVWFTQLPMVYVGFDKSNAFGFGFYSTKQEWMAEHMRSFVKSSTGKDVSRRRGWQEGQNPSAQADRKGAIKNVLALAYICL